MRGTALASIGDTGGITGKFNSVMEALHHSMHRDAWERHASPAV
jgi:hypothetical protein